MDIKKVLGWVLVALVLFFVISQPGQAANLVHNIVDWLQHGAGQFINFVSRVFNGG